MKLQWQFLFLFSVFVGAYSPILMANGTICRSAQRSIMQAPIIKIESSFPPELFQGSQMGVYKTRLEGLLESAKQDGNKLVISTAYHVASSWPGTFSDGSPAWVVSRHPVNFLSTDAGFVKSFRMSDSENLTTKDMELVGLEDGISRGHPLPHYRTPALIGSLVVLKLKRLIYPSFISDIFGRKQISAQQMKAYEGKVARIVYETTHDEWNPKEEIRSVTGVVRLFINKHPNASDDMKGYWSLEDLVDLRQEATTGSHMVRVRYVEIYEPEAHIELQLPYELNYRRSSKLPRYSDSN
jgi:hypothetical protein